MRRGMVIICVMVAVCALMLMGTATKAEAQIIVPGTVAWQVSDGAVATTTIAGPLRLRTFYRAAPIVNVEVAPRAARNYAVVASDAAPFVRAGLFRDRIVQPRRQVLSIVPQ